MLETIELGDVSIAVTRKDIKHVHLSVYPPDGRVTLSAPWQTRLEAARAYAISKLGWIRAQQEKLASQARETPRQLINRESHYLWGRRHLMTVVHRDVPPFVALDQKDLLEYIIVHEMAHLIEPTHSDRFIAVLSEHYPSWREARVELNELPLTAEVWDS